MKENVKELLKLVNENPELEIIPVVHSDVVGEDYGIWRGHFGSVYIDEYWENDDRYYLKSWDEEEVMEDLADNLCMERELADLSDDEFEERVEEEFDNIPWMKAIIVVIN